MLIHRFFDKSNHESMELLISLYRLCITFVKSSVWILIHDLMYSFMIFYYFDYFDNEYNFRMPRSSTKCRIWNRSPYIPSELSLSTGKDYFSIEAIFKLLYQYYYWNEQFQIETDKNCWGFSFSHHKSWSAKRYRKST